ncbi:hypothetical protein CCHL11_02624 [Colletotrichum chlorophyti]|uniref:Celp0028 effector like protein n=1 Tax=Colletotrichum chlorophyti TaxID=708187 RepID=A0A1Q8S960_9PEZI|nr:hypothetical protein CCHL11_02624 [Colletotrichum chlorophyti]
MRFLLSLALCAFSTAAPTVNTVKESAESLVASITPVNLSHDDVILYGVNGEYKVIKEQEFNNLTSSGVLTYGNDDDTLAARDLDSALLEARQNCPGLNQEFVVDKETDFLDWDVQMSPAIGAIQAPVTIAITRGYQVANSLTIGGSATGSYKWLSVALKADYDWTWTTIDTNMITYTVPQGNYGVVISQPWTHRKTGRIFTSCTTDNWQTSPYQADTHTSQQFGQFNWVKGVFRLCASPKYPVPFCSGNGEHR